MRPQRVAVIGADWPIYEKYCPNFVGMQKGLEAMGIEYRFFSCRPQLSPGDVIAYGPDLVIYGLLDMVRHGSWRHAIRAGLPDAKIVMWYGDLRNEAMNQITADMSEIDMMFVSNYAQSDFYRKIWRVPECHFLPLGSQIFETEYDPRFAFDFVFIGGVITGAGFMERAQTIWRYKEAGLKVLDADVRRPALRARIMKSMPTIYRSSKVVLDQSHFTEIPGYTSNRFWIITASGGFALTKRWPGCEEFYPEGTRAYFETFEESLELRDYYIGHPEEREKIRLAGYEQARLHTYEKRFARMFEKLYARKEDQVDHARIGAGGSGLASRTSIEEHPQAEAQTKTRQRSIA